MTKSSPRPSSARRSRRQAATVPEVSGAVPFRGEAQPFAGTYDIQVAANADRNFSATNLKVNTSSKRPAFTTGTRRQATLQASDTPYVWRVRRVDPTGNTGHWSAVGEFKVALDQPDACWPPTPDAVGRTPRRRAAVGRGRRGDQVPRRVPQGQGTTSATTATTPATALAPATALTVGTHLRVAGRVGRRRRPLLRPRAWRTFTVGGMPTATSAGHASTALASSRRRSPPSRRRGASRASRTPISGVATAHPIAGATGTTYVVRAEDVDALDHRGRHRHLGGVRHRHLDQWAVVGKAGAGPGRRSRRRRSPAAARSAPS